MVAHQFGGISMTDWNQGPTKVKSLSYSAALELHETAMSDDPVKAPGARCLKYIIEPFRTYMENEANLDRDPAEVLLGMNVAYATCLAATIQCLCKKGMEDQLVDHSTDIINMICKKCCTQDQDQEGSTDDN